MGAKGFVLKPLERISGDAIYRAFSIAFSEYEIQLKREALETMLKRRGFVPELSFGAFHEGELVSFTFNGIGDFGGVKTAYDTGTGTLKEYRGKGLASSIFKHSIPFLKEAGISKYLLEVLQHNEAAVSVYSKLGFEITREFNYFNARLNRVKVPDKAIDKTFDIRRIDLAVSKDMEVFWDFIPSWQNDFASIHRSQDEFKMLGGFTEGKLVGYAIFAPDSGDVTQIAVDKSYRRKGLGTSLFYGLLPLLTCDSIKVINVESSCVSLNFFMESLSLPLAGRQYEMEKIL